MNDLRFAVRQLAKAPGFTAVVVFSLALGIGATTTVLGWLRHLVWRPIPGVSAAHELVALVSTQGSGPVSRPDFEDFLVRKDIFAGGLLAMSTPASLVVGNTPHWIQAEVISAEGFDLLGVKPVIGRTFQAGEDGQPGGNALLVISERLWRREFAADPAVVGRVVELNRMPFTIVGVTPVEFLGTGAPVVTEAWAPMSMITEVRNQSRVFLEVRTARGWHNLVRLQPGVSLEAARAAVATIDAQLTAAYPDTNRGVRHRLVPLAECPWSSGPIVGPAGRLLLAVCGGVLLIVAANVANLLLVRATQRRREVAIRLASGASRARVVALFLVESLLLALAGGALGAMLAVWAIDTLPLLVTVPVSGVQLAFPLDPVTLGWTLALTLGTGLVFGLAPAWQASRPDLNEALKEGGRSGMGSRRQNRVRRSLVVVEVALAVVLLIGAALCLKGMERARQLDLGLDPGQVLRADMRIGMNGYDAETGLGFYRRLRERLREFPGVEEAALASWLPLGLAGCKGSGVKVDGYQPREGENPTYEYAIVSPGYFATLRIPLVAGRDFTEGDDQQAGGVAIVNQTFAQRFWPDHNPLGRKFRSLGRDLTIVGLVPTGRYNRLDEDPTPFFFVPFLQGVPDLDLGVVVRTAGDPMEMAEGLRRVVREVDPGVGLMDLMPMTAHVEGSYFGLKMATQFLALLGVAALALTAMGVYAVMAYSVTQRIPEFGLRMALGATAGKVRQEVVRDGLKLALVGAAAGILLAAATTRVLAGFLYGVSPFDPLVFAAVPVLLCGLAVAATWMPAWRATQASPLVALRCE